MRERHTITVINRTEDVEKRALTMAQDDLRKEQHTPLGPQRWKPTKWIKKLALHFGEEYYRQRGKKRARKAILENNNVYTSVDTMNDRVIHGYNKKPQSRAAGLAKIEQVHLPDTVQDKHFQQSEEVQGTLKALFVNEVLRPIVEGKVLAESSVQRKLRNFVAIHSKNPNKEVAKQVKELFGKKATSYGKMAEFFATDVKEIGDVIRQEIAENKYSLDELTDHVDLTFANTTWAAATKEHRSVINRTVTAIQKRPWSRTIFNETTVGAVTAATSFVLLRGSTRALSALTLGAGAGAIIGATQRNRNLKHDIASHRTDKEYNQHATAYAKRRSKLDRYNYAELASVADLLYADRSRSTIDGDTRSLQSLLSLPTKEDNREALVTRIAEIQERLRFSTQKRAGFVTYDEATQVEQGRLALVKGIIKGKQTLIDAYIAQGVPLTQAKAEVDRQVQETTEKWNKLFTKEYKKQRRKFFGYRMRSSLAHGAIGGTIGMVSGALAQEATAGIMRLTGETVAPTILEKPFVNEELVGKKIQMTAKSGDIWTSHRTPISHREWYAYNTARSNYNELKLHTIKKGTGIDLVMENMGWSSQSELTPPNLYVPHVEQAGHAAYAITLPGQEHKPVIVMADNRGTLHLDPRSHNSADIVRFADGKTMQRGELSRQLLNPSVYAGRGNGDIATEVNHLRKAFAIGGRHGNLGEISAGRVVEQDGKTIWQSFATIFGTGRTHEAKTPNVILQFEKPTEIPAIPLVVTRRKPLEPRIQR